MARTSRSAQPLETRKRILVAALQVIRMRGYSATRVEDICEAAAVTKGAFFHYFKSKEDLAVAAAEFWGEITGQLFAQAEYHSVPDPVQKLLAYIDYRRQLIAGEIASFTCLAGTMVQEVYETHPAIREACARSICGHAGTVEELVERAMEARGLRPEWTARSLALHTQAVIQGAFILAKAEQNPTLATESIDHLRRYVAQLFVN